MIAPGKLPVRIQLSRRKGWRMPPNTVTVARPSKWGNPFRVGAVGAETPERVVALYAKWLRDDNAGLRIASEARLELRGKNLACWCPLARACHGDVLLEAANAPAYEAEGVPSGE